MDREAARARLAERLPALDTGRALIVADGVEETVTYAELGGVRRSRILPFYVMRNALVPQVTGLAMSLGGIFTGAIIVETVFGYPGLGRLLVGQQVVGAEGFRIVREGVQVGAVPARRLEVFVSLPFDLFFGLEVSAR